jgi:rhamnose transport system permease protein
MADAPTYRPAGAATTPGDRAVLFLGRFRELGTAAIIAALVLSVMTRTSYFLTKDNVEQILLAVSIIAVVAVGETLVILTRNVDLSVEAMVGLVAFAVGDLMKSHGYSVPEAVVAGCLIGAALGAFNGLLIVVGRVPSIVATLGTLSIFRGLDFYTAGGKEVSAGDVPASFENLAVGHILGIPAMVLWAVIIAVIAGYVLHSTRTGRRIYAVGGNPDAAALVGIPSGRIVFGVFTVCGLLCGIVGVLWASRFGTVNAHAAEGLSLEVIAAVVVGGVAIFGGAGTVLGAMLGALLLGTIENALILLHVSPFWLKAIDGAIILAAVAIDALVTRRAQRALVRRRT